MCTFIKKGKQLFGKINFFDLFEFLTFYTKTDNFTSSGLSMAQIKRFPLVWFRAFFSNRKNYTCTSFYWI